MREMLLSEVIHAVDGEFRNDLQFKDKYISGIVTDSKKVGKGDIFLAIRGGHNYIAEAFKNGAAACIAEDYEDSELPIIFVDDSVEALMLMAEYYRSLFNIPCIAITGSNGKTTTKELIYSILSTKYNVLKNEGNFNNEIGLPLTIFNLEDEHEILITEMGMNHYGEISKLTKIAKPDIAIITNIGDNHLEFFGSRKGILKSKLEILEEIDNKGKLILDGDDDLLATIDERITDKDIEIIRVGIDEDCDVQYYDFEQNSLDSIKFDVLNKMDNNIFNYEVVLNAVGEHTAKNALFACAVAELFDLTNEEIIEGFKNFKNVGSRLEIFNYKGATIINDAYNASTLSMNASFKVLDSVEKGRRILCIGDIFELGSNANKIHRELGESLLQYKFDEIILVGENMKECYKVLDKNKVPNVEYFSDTDDLQEYIQKILHEGDTILFKASNGMKLHEIANFFKNEE